MYTIIKKLNGKYLCLGRLQDGTERWETDTLEEAIKSLKEFAKFANGARGKHKLKRKQITYLQEQSVQVSQCVPWNPE